MYGIRNDERDIVKARRRIGAVVETPSIYPDMTAEDNLKQQYLVLGLPSFEGLRDILKLVGLGETGKKKVKDFSLGMRQRLGIAIALVGDPDFLILDEPVNDLDPQGIVEVRELILRLNRERQITVLISSHILDELAKIATVLHTANVDHKILSATSAEIYAKVNISKLAAELAKENCEIFSMQEKDEDLESYFFSLVGGSSYE